MFAIIWGKNGGVITNMPHYGLWDSTFNASLFLGNVLKTVFSKT